MTMRVAVIGVVAGLIGFSTVVAAEPPESSNRENAPGRVVSEEAKRLRELK